MPIGTIANGESGSSCRTKINAAFTQLDAETAAGIAITTAANAAAQRTALGLVIGTNVQAYDADLTTWAGITPGANVGIALAVAVGSGGALVTNGGALGTPSSGVLTNCTGTAAGLTAGNATIAKINMSVLGL